MTRTTVRSSKKASRFDQITIGYLKTRKRQDKNDGDNYTSEIVAEMMLLRLVADLQALGRDGRASEVRSEGSMGQSDHHIRTDTSSLGIHRVVRDANH